MAATAFVSYSHRDGEWVWERLVPCLRATGIDVLIDRERFVAGVELVGQMDAAQRDAQHTLLVLSPNYLASAACRHELEGALASDPAFASGSTIPILRAACELPEAITAPDPLAVDLTDDARNAGWELLLRALDASLGVPATDWLQARDAVRRSLQRNNSVNLAVDRTVAWRGLLDDLTAGDFPDLRCIDLQKPTTASRRGLVKEIVGAFGSDVPIPDPPDDLGELQRCLDARDLSRLVFTHFDLVPHRGQYDVDLFAALRYMAVETKPKKLVLLIQSRAPFSTLLPPDHPLSTFQLDTVELRAKA